MTPDIPIEYLFIDAQTIGTAGSTVEARFNVLGNEGWDYCGNAFGCAIFKRIRRQTMRPTSAFGAGAMNTAAIANGD